MKRKSKELDTVSFLLLALRGQLRVYEADKRWISTTKELERIRRRPKAR